MRLSFAALTKGSKKINAEMAHTGTAIISDTKGIDFKKVSLARYPPSHIRNREIGKRINRIPANNLTFLLSTATVSEGCIYSIDGPSREKGGNRTEPPNFSNIQQRSTSHLRPICNEAPKCTSDGAGSDGPPAKCAA